MILDQPNLLRFQALASIFEFLRAILMQVTTSVHSSLFLISASVRNAGFVARRVDLRLMRSVLSSPTSFSSLQL